MRGKPAVQKATAEAASSRTPHPSVMSYFSARPRLKKLEPDLSLTASLENHASCGVTVKQIPLFALILDVARSRAL